MKVLKTIIIILVVIIGIGLIAAFFIPKEYNVERSIEINAPQEVIYSQIVSFHAHQDWSPWNERDTNMVVTYEGNDGEVGSKYHWKGNEDVGEGIQEMTVQNEMGIETKLSFKEPMEAESTTYLRIEEKEGKLFVVWGLDGSTPWPMNLTNLMMDKMLGADFEYGLSKLKKICEEMPEKPKTYRGYTVNEVEIGPMNFIGHREVVKFQDMKAFYEKYLPAVFQISQDKQWQPAGMPMGVFFKYEEENMQADMAVGAPFAGEITDLPEGYESYNIEGKAALVEYYGAYDKSQDAHYAIHDYLKENELELNELVIEEYVTDPGSEADTTKWLTKIYYLVK